MSGNDTTRPSAGQVLDRVARKALAELRKFEARAAEANEQAKIARSELSAIHRKTCERFGRDLPTDALLLDVLQLVDIEDGDRWTWDGPRNNKDLATLRVDRQEVSVVRYLAVELGVIAEDDFGVLYPIDGDVDDVNPWHRKLRRTAAPVGRFGRWTFDPEADQ